MDINEYIPKDKHDHERVEQLKKLSREDIKRIIPELMEWLQDQNWPVSQGVEDILINSQDDLILHKKCISNN
jgi:hypothetical protein